MWHFQQILFKCFYKGGSNSEGGTLLQLRNMLNRQNVAADVSGRFNSTVDFVELVTNCHIVAAAMNFFGMKNVSSNSTNNALPSDITKWPVDRQWNTFSKAIGQIVDRYVIVNEFASTQPQSAVSMSQKSSSLEQNPHVSRITINIHTIQRQDNI